MPVCRRVQRTGTATHTISLPKEWVKRQGIKPGAELYIFEEEDGSLSVKTRGEAHSVRSAEINVDEIIEPVHLRRTFLAKYLKGYNVIRIYSKGKGIPSELRSAVIAEVDRLIGVEVTEEKSDEIVVQDFFSHQGLSVEKTMKRAYMLASGMQENAVRAFLYGNEKVARDVIAMDDEVDRLRYLVTRQLNLALSDSGLMRSLGITASDCLEFASLSRCIEGIGDENVKIAENTLKALRKRRALQDSVRAIERRSDDAARIHSGAVKAFFDRDFMLANKMLALREEIADEEAEVVKNEHARMVVESLDRIADYGAEIAELAVDRVKK